MRLLLYREYVVCASRGQIRHDWEACLYFYTGSAKISTDAAPRQGRLRPSRGTGAFGFENR
jgi:hypothetical protein